MLTLIVVVLVLLPLLFGVVNLLTDRGRRRRPTKHWPLEPSGSTYLTVA